MGKYFEKATTTALIVTAMAVAASVVSEELLERPAPQLLVDRNPEFVKGWKDALLFSTRVAGDEAAPIVILALVDFECPFCRVFHEAAVDLASQRPEEVQLRYVHYPLSYHRFAWAAAHGAECAREHGRAAFGRWVDAVYSDQESFGRRSWSSYAEEAELPEPQRIEQCVSDARYENRIRAGSLFGEEIGVDRTPTVLVNGWRYFRPPNSVELRRAIDALLNGSFE